MQISEVEFKDLYREWLLRRGIALEYANIANLRSINFVDQTHCLNDLKSQVGYVMTQVLNVDIMKRQGHERVKGMLKLIESFTDESLIQAGHNSVGIDVNGNPITGSEITKQWLQIADTIFDLLQEDGYLLLNT